MKYNSIIRNKSLLRSLFWIWFMLIIVIAIIPNLTSGGRDRAEGWWGIEIRLDYIAHFLLYFIFAFLFICWKVDERMKLDEWVLLAFVFGGLMLGVIDEYHQKIVPGRTFNPKDMFYNVLGLLLGVLFTYFLFLRWVMRCRKAD